MARGEFEGGQLVVQVPSYAPAPLRNVTWQMASLQHAELPGVVIPTGDVAVMPVGFVHEGPCPFDSTSSACPADKLVQCKLGDHANNTQRCVAHGGGATGSVQCVGCSGSSGMTNTAAFYSHTDARGWWPGPLLDTVTEFDVSVGTVQPLYVLVRTRPDTKPGTYTGELSVWPSGLPHTGRLVRVIVHDVMIPHEQPLTLWGEEASEVEAAFAHSVDPPKPPKVPNPMGHLYANTSAYIELMLDHKMPGGTGIYHGMYMPTTHNLSQADVAALAELWARGQRMAVIETFTDCQSPERVATHACNLAGRLDAMVMTAQAFKSAGWPEENLFVYVLPHTPASSIYI